MGLELSVLVKLFVDAGFSIVLLAFVLIDKKAQTTRLNKLEDRSYEAQTQYSNLLAKVSTTQEHQTRALEEVIKVVNTIECHRKEDRHEKIHENSN